MTNIESWLAALSLLQLLILLSVLSFRNQNPKINQTNQGNLLKSNESSVEIVPLLVKKYETELHNQVTTLTNETTRALRSSLTATTADLKKEFAKQLAVLLQTWAVDKQQVINQTLNENIVAVSNESAALVMAVTQTSLKRKLNLEDHHQLAQEAIQAILMKVQV